MKERLASPDVAASVFGAVGAPAGTFVVAFDAVLEIPAEFVATTLTVYETPLVRPVMAHPVVASLYTHAPAACDCGSYAVAVYVSV